MTHALVEDFGPGLSVALNGQIISRGGDVVITDIGEGSNALGCRTDRADCCDNAPPVRTRRGDWRFPDGSLVGTNGGDGDFYKTRGQQRVFLNRRSNAMGPLGMYCCDVDTVDDPDATICINISKT